MANRHRGEVDADLGDRRLTLCLTLGALAELEDAFQVDDLDALVARLGSGRLSARDVVRILGAGIRGAGTPLSDGEIAALPFRGGVTGAVALAAALLEATFGAEAGAVTEPDP
jgi:hypothetical protein